MLSMNWFLSKVALDSGVSISKISYHDHGFFPRRKVTVTIEGTEEEGRKVKESINKCMFEDRNLVTGLTSSNEYILNFNDW